MNPGNLHSHLSADRPIQSAKEDLFRREKFAQAIAKAIRGWTGQDSLVMALYGPWGVGKTSVKNLIVESLSLDMKPRVLEFNPWEWAGRDQIQRAFFAQLTVLFGKVDPSAKGQKLVERLERYASILEGVSINDNFTRVGELIAVFIGLVTLKTVSDTFIQLPDWLQNLTSIGVVILGILVCIATFFRWGFKAIVAVYKKPEQLLTEQREELRKSLQKLGAPVLIVIDDIDRLSSIEIAQVFQLVKANADFPNLVFLLLFDRDVVEASLVEVTKGNPREYLEKIVQAAFTIPAASRTELDKYTFEAIQSICKRRNIAQRLDEADMLNGYGSGVRTYIQDLRDAKRFLGSFALHVAVFQSETTFEVNPRDLMLLETLRVFEPALYDTIARSKEWLVPQHQSLQTKEPKLEIDTMMKTVQSDLVDAQKILAMLFPHQGRLFGAGSSSDSVSFRPTWFKESRVCHPDVFDRYFQLGIPSGDVSQNEIEHVLSLSGDKKSLLQIFDAFKQRGLIAPLLDRLDYYTTGIDPAHAVPFLAALFELGDQLDDGFNWIQGAERSIQRLTYFCFRECVLPASRVDVFQQALNAAPGYFYVPMKLLFLSLKNDERQFPEILSQADFDQLYPLIVSQIEDAAKSGELTEHVHRLWIYSRWVDWTSINHVQTWMGTQLTDRTRFVKLLRGFYLQSSHSIGPYASRIKTYIGLEDLTTFLSQQQVLDAWDQLGVNQPTQEEVLLLEAIRNAKSRNSI